MLAIRETLPTNKRNVLIGVGAMILGIGLVFLLIILVLLGYGEQTEYES